MAGKGRIVGGTAAAVLALTAAVLWGPSEGRVHKAYYDAVQVLTICEGHTGADVTPEQVASDGECDRLTEADLKLAYSVVVDAVEVDMTVGQASAFTDFTGNMGAQAFRTSTMLRLFNAGQWQAACNELSKWIYAGRGPNRRVLRGLVTRREKERQLCLYGAIA